MSDFSFVIVTHIAFVLTAEFIIIVFLRLLLLFSAENFLYWTMRVILCVIVRSLARALLQFDKCYVMCDTHLRRLSHFTLCYFDIVIREFRIIKELLLLLLLQLLFQRTANAWTTFAFQLLSNNLPGWACIIDSFFSFSILSTCERSLPFIFCSFVLSFVLNLLCNKIHVQHLNSRKIV